MENTQPTVAIRWDKQGLTVQEIQGPSNNSMITAKMYHILSSQIIPFLPAVQSQAVCEYLDRIIPIKEWVTEPIPVTALVDTFNADRVNIAHLSADLTLWLEIGNEFEISDTVFPFNRRIPTDDRVEYFFKVPD
jgi:hypothetical protein